MSKLYDLRSEMQKVATKNPPFGLMLPEVGEYGQPGYFEAQTVSIPAAKNLPDNVVEASVTNVVAAARLLLGENYPHFTAAGGRATTLFAIINENAGAADSGESDGSTDS